MRNVVIRNIPRAAEATIKRLGECGTATVHEAMGRVGLMQPYMRPIYDGAAVAGSAVTVLWRTANRWSSCRPSCLDGFSISTLCTMPSVAISPRAILQDI